MASKWYVHDRNREGAILAGPFPSKDEAETEKGQWAGATDPYVVESQDQDRTEEIASDLADGNPDEAIAEAVEELEPAAGEIAEAALEEGRPDLAAEVVIQTLESLADMAEAELELAETLEEVAAELDDAPAEAAAEDAAEAAEEAAEEVEELLEEAGVPEAVAEAEVEPMDGTEEILEDIPPEPSHWLFRRRFSRSAL